LKIEFMAMLSQMHPNILHTIHNTSNRRFGHTEHTPHNNQRVSNPQIWRNKRVSPTHSVHDIFRFFYFTEMILLRRPRLGMRRSTSTSIRLQNSANEPISAGSLRSVTEFVSILSTSTKLSPTDANSIIRASMLHANQLNPENTTKVLRFCASNRMCIVSIYLHIYT